MRYSAFLPTIAGVIAGALAGGAVVLLTSSGESIATSGATKSKTAPHAAGDDAKTERAALRRQIAGVRSGQPADTDTSEKIAELERRLDELKGPATDPDQLLHEVRARSERARQEFTERVASFERDTVDPEWGPATTTLLTTSLADVAAVGGGYKAVDVKCRMDSCKATLRWDSRERAEAGLAETASAPLKTNCGRTVSLNDSEAEDGSQEATLLLDCTEWRASGSVPLEAVIPNGASQTALK
jgi:hypothetical protein